MLWQSIIYSTNNSKFLVSVFFCVYFFACPLVNYIDAETMDSIFGLSILIYNFGLSLSLSCPMAFGIFLSTVTDHEVADEDVNRMKRGAKKTIP